ncbi:transcriptional regulator [Listeria floridensis FSL S10-1187]|uniref:Transcriptional regulator n=1 Tax=Listeria floridensis FSL S10-1187 TaxID=1265817 RepID=A0ABN0RIW0_9LIST|nr:MarR family transcriptional regulator [Listeria floridensis]EUJ33831.1 transcriptional regulator [Listeria floridensis FSL S10-1187]
MENQDLMKQFLKLDKMMHRYQGMRMQHFGPMGNPYRGQGRVLSLLKMQPEITQKKLGFLLDMRNQSLGELLAKLEKQELITREPSEEDRRVMNIKLTDSGKERAEEMDHSDKHSGELFDVLTDEEKEQLSGLLLKVTARLEEIREEMIAERPELEDVRGGAPFGFEGGAPFGGGFGGTDFRGGKHPHHPHDHRNHHGFGGGYGPRGRDF